jgi:hypothetical protein
MTGARLGAVVLLGPALALAAGDGSRVSLDVTASCERKATKGRVLCDVDLEAREGRIAWADAVVTDAPPFAPPLRSRVGLADARSRTERRVRLPVAFIATSQGRGTIALRARAVLCRAATPGDAETCRPATRDVSTEIIVGANVEH